MCCSQCNCANNGERKIKIKPLLFLIQSDNKSFEVYLCISTGENGGDWRWLTMAYMQIANKHIYFVWFFGIDFENCLEKYIYDSQIGCNTWYVWYFFKVGDLCVDIIFICFVYVSCLVLEFVFDLKITDLLSCVCLFCWSIFNLEN